MSSRPLRTQVLVSLQKPTNRSARAEWQWLSDLWQGCAEQALADDPDALVVQRSLWRAAAASGEGFDWEYEEYETRFWGEVLSALKTGDAVFKTDPDAPLLRSPMPLFRRSAADVVACADCTFEYERNYRKPNFCRSQSRMRDANVTVEEDWLRTGFHLNMGTIFFRPRPRVVRLLELAKQWQARSITRGRRGLSVPSEQHVFLQVLGSYGCRWSAMSGEPLTPKEASKRLMLGLKAGQRVKPPTEEEDRRQFSVFGHCAEDLTIEVLSYGLCPRTILSGVRVGASRAAEKEAKSKLAAVRLAKDAARRRQAKEGPILFHAGGPMPIKMHRIRDLMRPLWERLSCLPPAPSTV